MTCEKMGRQWRHFWTWEELYKGKRLNGAEVDEGKQKWRTGHEAMTGDKHDQKGRGENRITIRMKERKFYATKRTKHKDINTLLLDSLWMERLNGEQRRKTYFHITSIACWNCSCSFCSCSASCNELAVISPAFSMDSPLRIQPST